MLHPIITSIGAVIAAQASQHGAPAPLAVLAPLANLVAPAPLALYQAPRPRRWGLELEAGAVFSNRNDIRSPGDSGTRFSLNDLTGEGAFGIGRVTLEYDLNERHGLRLLYAPVRTHGVGELRKDIRFEDQNFAAGTARARYRFDTYRLAYRYRFAHSENWTWKGGASLLIRDASIELDQGGITDSKSNVGVVPLLNLTGEWRFAQDWVGIFDFEGAAASQGRAFDVALKVGYQLTPDLRLSAGYRTIEGGADNDEVFTFSWFNSAVVSLRWTF